MATITITDSGGTRNWSDAATWSTGVKPTAADEIIATATSGNVTINEAAVCRSMNLTNYTSTLTHNAFSLTIGDGTAPTGLLALKLVSTYSPNASSSIVFTSSAVGVHTVDTGAKTIQAITFNNTGSYQFVTNTITVTGSITHTNGIIDFNGLSATIGANLLSTGTSSRTLTLGASIITFTGTSSQPTITGSNFNITINSATFILSGISTGFSTVDSTNFNGLSLKITGSAGSISFYNTCTIQNFIIDPTTTKTISITVGKTITLTGNLYCQPTAGQVKFTTGSISKSSGTVNLYQVAASSTTTFTGGATWNLRNNCDVVIADASTYGLSRSSPGYSYIDYVNGSDNFYTAYGFHKVEYTDASGVCPIEDEIMLGGTSGSSAKVSYIRPFDWSTGIGTLYFKSKSAPFTAETLTGQTGGSTCSIAKDTSSAAWQTITSGALAARIAPNDIICIAQSPDSSSMGTAVWTDQSTNLPASKTITTSTNSGGLVNINVNVSTHGFTTGDVVYIQDHLGSSTVNGCWSITSVDASHFTLDGATYVTNGTQGTVTLVNRSAVKLTTAQTLTITRNENAWTAGASGDAVATVDAYNLDRKEGMYSTRIILDSAVQTNKLQAYFPVTIAGVTLNNYQKLSFWFKNDSAITCANSTTFMWYVALCSDSSGAVPIDTFPIPAIPSLNRWVPLTIQRCDTSTNSFVAGGNLGGNTSTQIQSIAMYSGATAPANSSRIYIDNFVACVSAGLNLQSLISKNASTQGYDTSINYANEGWHCIQSISEDGKILKIDNDTNAMANLSITTRGTGYTGTSGLFTTYMREAIKTSLASGQTTSVNTINDIGLVGLNIQYQFGYNLITGLQTGETFFDGLNGNGYGINFTSISYTTINYASFCRYYTGIFSNSGNSNIFSTITNLCSNTYGIFFQYGNNNLVNTIINSNNNGIYSVYLSYCNSNIFNKLTHCNSNYNYGIIFVSSISNIINFASINNSGTSAIYYQYSSESIIREINSTYNALAITSIYGGTHYIQNYMLNDSIDYLNGSPGVQDNSMIYCQNYRLTGYEKIFTNYATIVSQASTLTNGSGKEWKIEVTNIFRTSAYPLRFPIARVAVAANSVVTIKLWMKKSHATNIIANLVCMENQVAGLTTRNIATKANNTDEEQVTLTLDKPTETGVIEIEVQAYWGGATANVIFDKLTISQA